MPLLFGVHVRAGNTLTKTSEKQVDQKERDIIHTQPTKTKVQVHTVSKLNRLRNPESKKKEKSPQKEKINK